MAITIPNGSPVPDHQTRTGQILRPLLRLVPGWFLQPACHANINLLFLVARGPAAIQHRYASARRNIPTRTRADSAPPARALPRFHMSGLA